MKKSLRLLCLLLCISVTFGLLPSCGAQSGESPAAPVFTNYRDVPGVTADEIARVEALREKYPRFIYGMLPSTEAFMGADGQISGFGPEFSRWLGVLFDIPFEPAFLTGLDVTTALQSGEADFTGDLSMTPERLNTYIATDPIAMRSLVIIRHVDSLPPDEIALTRKPRYAFRSGTVSIENFAAAHDPDSYESVLIDSAGVVYPMLRDGEIDALVALNTARAAFATYDDLIIEDYFPPIFSPVSLTAINPEFRPIIDIVQKALAAGADRHLSELYKQGFHDYCIHELNSCFNEDELNFMAANPLIPIAMEYDNYPISFYNERYETWQGISMDILREVEEFTGLKFAIAHGEDADWSEVYRLFDEGRAHIISDLGRSLDREASYLWAENYYLTDHSTLISKAELPEIGINDILSLNVGITRDTIHVDLFKAWFPGHRHITEYDSNADVLDALMNGEIDVAMSTSRLLLQLTHYYELPGYKIAFDFDNNIVSTFGFNENQAILQNIVDKSLEMIDTDAMANSWLRRTYDYRSQLIEAQRPYIVGAIFILILLLFFLAFVYMKDKKRSRKILMMQKRTDTIVQNIPGMVFQQRYDPPEYTYTFVSEGSVELLGYGSDELLSGKRAFLDLIHPEDRDHIVKHSLETLPLGLAFEATYRIRTKDGEEKWIWERSRVIEMKQDGTPKIVEGYCTDVSESKRMEAAEQLNQVKMAEMNENLTLILDSMPVGIRVVALAGGELLYTNRTLLSLLGDGEPVDDIVGQNIFDFMPEIQSDGRKTVDMANELMAQGRGTMDFECTRVSGEGFIARVSSCNINYMGQPSSLAAIEDMTERNKMMESIRRAEMAEASNKAKSQFLATMSHEIRTPMNSIMGFAELALDSEKMEQIKDYLDKITDGAKWLLNIIDDILDISKIEAGKIELERVPFNIHEIFGRCQSVILPAVKEKGLDFRVYAEPLPGRKLVGDQVRLYQVLINLLSNAVKFTDMGVIKFSSTVREIGDNHATVYFEVQDTGIGMTPEQIERIYEPFMQADSSTTRNYGGTGLGLSITQGIVEMMGGQLSVESVHGEGSRFSFELTFGTIESSDDPMERENIRITQKPIFDGLILICDDNSMNREVICEHLLRVGIRTVVAENGLEAVQLVSARMEDEKAAFDLIFMDMFMPVMDGLEAAQKIVALGVETPIIAMTANVMTSELEVYKKSGMPDCLGKPFTSQELWRLLLKYLTPVSSSTVDEHESDGQMIKKLRSDFVKGSRGIHAQIAAAAAAGDMKVAHRLAHTLKGNAGLIGKPELRAAAYEVEMILKEGADSIWESKMKRLESELEAVFEEFEILGDVVDETAKVEALSDERVRELFAELGPMLADINPECVNLLSEIRAIPGGEELARLIENFDFTSAAKELTKLMKAYE